MTTQKQFAELTKQEQFTLTCHASVRKDRGYAAWDGRYYYAKCRRAAVVQDWQGRGYCKRHAGQAAA